MLQAFRLTLTELDKSIDAGAQLFAALKSRTVLAASTLDGYEHQLALLTRYREQMEAIVAHGRTMVEDSPAIDEPHRDPARSTPPPLPLAS